METKDAVYFFGLIITLFLGVWNLLQSHLITRKKDFITTVTSQRIIWIEQLRQDIAMLSGLVRRLAFTELNDWQARKQTQYDIDRLSHVIRLRLNPTEPYDKRIEQLVKKISGFQPDPPIDLLRDTLEDLTVTGQGLLKQEWEKVKREAEHGRLSGSRSAQAHIALLS